MNDHPTNTELSAILLLNACRGRGAAVPRRAVSEKELIALAAGDIEPGTRAEMLATIACDDELYRNWLELLEASDTLDAIEKRAERRPSLVARTAEWLGSFRLAWVAGPVLAAFIVLVVLPMAGPGQDIRQLYARWGPELQPNIGEVESVFRGEPGGTAGGATGKGLEQQWFEWGIYRGLRELGDGFAITGLPDYLLGATIPPESTPTSEALSDNGSLVILTYFGCRQNMGQKYFEDTLRVLRAIGDAPSEWSLGAGVPEAAQLGEYDLQVALCGQADSLIKKLVVLNH